MHGIRNIVILTGAGISAESGLRTFRADDGLWEDHRVEDVATPQGFRRDPALVQRFYDERRAALSRVEPNAAHVALARLEQALGDELLVITQNVDDLHERAGSTRVHHIHGRLRSAWCTTCDQRHHWDGPLADGPQGALTAPGTRRPDVGWFGEIPYGMDLVEEALWECDLFVSIGTSGVVYPAAAFVHWARRETLELNLEPGLGASDFAESRQGPASHLVPAWVEEVLGEGGPNSS